jgi:hypothetical protein
VARIELAAMDEPELDADDDRPVPGEGPLHRLVVHGRRSGRSESGRSATRGGDGAAARREGSRL